MSNIKEQKFPQPNIHPPESSIESQWASATSIAVSAALQRTSGHRDMLAGTSKLISWAVSAWELVRDRGARREERKNKRWFWVAIKI